MIRKRLLLAWDACDLHTGIRKSHQKYYPAPRRRIADVSLKVTDDAGITEAIERMQRAA